jgi:transcription initiation factor TFIIE subunit alpha
LESDVGEYIRSNLGQEVLEVADTISARELTDEEISKITGFRINDVRSSLYRLYDFRLAFYRRSRDPKTGWFIYHWRMDSDSRTRVLNGQKKKEIEVLQRRLEYEQSNIFFVCKAGNCSRFTFEVAADNGFKCPNCGSMLEHHDNSGIVESLQIRIRRLEEGIESDNGESG